MSDSSALFLGLGPVEWAALRLSLWVALWAVLGSLPLAVLTAFVLARGQFRGKAIVNALVLLPLVLPPVVTGYVLLLAFGARGPLGQAFEAAFGLQFAFRWTGAALAAGVMAFPLMVRAMRQALEAIDPGLEQAAGTLGAHPVRVFFTITLPLMMPGIVTGMVLGFAKALGEFGATITFVSNIPGQTQTLPLAIYNLLQVPGAEGAALRLVIASILLSLGAVLASELLAHRMTKRARGI